MIDRRWIIGISVGAVAAALGLSGARAAAGCTSPDGEDFAGPLSLRSVIAAPRVNFVKTALQRPGCPDPSTACRDKPYVVTGDAVLVTVEENGFVCATFTGLDGGGHTAWLPAGDLKPIAAATDGPKDWVGAWTTGSDQTVTIKAGPQASQISISGYATYGAWDPARVKRGDVNSGEISGIVRPASGGVAFTMGDAEATLPYEQGEPTACRIRMKRLGTYMLVDDTGNCGGMNVSFSGIYRRK